MINAKHTRFLCSFVTDDGIENLKLYLFNGSIMHDALFSFKWNLFTTFYHQINFISVQVH